jgi:hypothetical protein
MGTGALASVKSDQGMGLNAQSHLGLRFRMGRAVPLLSFYAFMACYAVAFSLLYFYVTNNLSNVCFLPCIVGVTA